MKTALPKADAVAKPERVIGDKVKFSASLGVEHQKMEDYGVPVVGGVIFGLAVAELVALVCAPTGFMAVAVALGLVAAPVSLPLTILVGCVAAFLGAAGIGTYRKYKKLNLIEGKRFFNSKLDVLGKFVSDMVFRPATVLAMAECGSLTNADRDLLLEEYRKWGFEQDWGEKELAFNETCEAAYVLANVKVFFGAGRGRVPTSPKREGEFYKGLAVEDLGTIPQKTMDLLEKLRRRHSMTRRQEQLFRKFKKIFES